jgi:hypothetical protein
VAAPAAGSAAPAGDPLLEGHTVMSREWQERWQGVGTHTAGNEGGLRYSHPCAAANTSF